MFFIPMEACRRWDSVGVRIVDAECAKTGHRLSLPTAKGRDEVTISGALRSCCCAPLSATRAHLPQVLREVDTIADLSRMSEEALRPLLGAANASKLYNFFRHPAPV